MVGRLLREAVISPVMSAVDAFESDVARRYQLYNGLFLNLPFADVRSTGIMLPVFAEFCREQLTKGIAPRAIVRHFLDERLGHLSTTEQTDYLFKFMQIAERQVVLFDALEDAAFARVHDLDGPGTVRDLLVRTAAERRDVELRHALAQQRVRVVLTAHPTQFYPDEILGILTDLAEAIEHSDTEGVHELLLQMGKTRFKKGERPTPLDEAKSLLWYVENVFYDALPAIQRQLADETEQTGSPRVELPHVAELGFWPGGDRDGNPFVTADLTAEVSALLRDSILRRYQDDLKLILRRLTFPGVAPMLREIDRKLSSTAASSFRPDRTDCTGYGCADELLEDLLAVYRRVETDHDGLFKELIADLVYKVRIFGFHFASMDLRQDSRVLRSVVAATVDAIGGGGYQQRTVLEKIDLLERIAGSLPQPRKHLGAFGDNISRDTIESLRVGRSIQARNGERGLHRYIISNTRDAANVMEVWYLAQLAGWSADTLAIDIVPLFETVDDLDRADETMTLLLDLPAYRDHLERRGWVQTIMLGFSDGTKDGGYVTANWEIFRAKQRLTALARERGIQVVFFDGRGGPPARGGGNTHMFYRTVGRSIESKEIHLTVQGQTISSNFGTPVSARYNTEQLVTAGLETMIYPDHHIRLNQSEINLIDELSSVAAAAYAQLKQHPQFLPYLEQVTPLRYYGQTNIGSRPTSRGNPAGLSLDSLRAIPFVGAWSQMKQNVPGYYGFGTALTALFDRGRGAELRALYKRSRFFRTLVENAMQSLSKTFFPLTAHLEKDPDFGELWQMLRDEANRATGALLTVSGQTHLLEADSAIRRSIQLREAIVLPVLVIQQYALAELRARPSDGMVTGDEIPNETLEKIVVKTMAATVNAARNAV